MQAISHKLNFQIFPLRSYFPSIGQNVRGAAQAVASIATFVVALSTATANEPLTFYGFDQGSYSTDAREGLEAIFSGQCFHNGLPVRALMVLTTARRSGGDLGYDPRSEAGQFYTAGNAPSPPGRQAGKAPGAGLGNSLYTRNGAMLANGNCFNCHAGIVNGQVVAGLGNAHINQPFAYQNLAQIVDQSEQLMAMMGTDAERKELADMLDFFNGVAANFKFAKTRGENFGPYPVWRMGANLIDPERQGMLVGDQKTELSELFTSTELPPVEPMAWWLMKYKQTDYWYADANPFDAAHFSGNFTTPHPEVNENRAEHVQTVAKGLAFARETTAPPYPRSLNVNLVQTGADLFHGRIKPQHSSGFKTCSNCHGSYDKKHSHPDLSIPGGWNVSYNHSKQLRDVKTDAAYNATLQKFRPIADHINKMEVYYTAKGTPELTPRVGVPNKSGYVAPPLVGVWATAPYFHNGSVPNIEAVLNSALRPAIWSRNCEDPHAYDLEHVGLKFKPLTEAEFDQNATIAKQASYLSKAAIDHQSIYDTRGFGRGNQGHTFGDHLTIHERTSIIEFLKSLSGPEMDPAFEINPDGTKDNEPL